MVSEPMEIIQFVAAAGGAEDGDAVVLFWEEGVREIVESLGIPLLHERRFPILVHAGSYPRWPRG
jgi:hypothetical protein